MTEKVRNAGNNAQGELKALAKNIQNSLKRSTVEKIKVGDWLIQARQLLASDNEFGEWCKNNFPGLNRHTRQNYMNLAKSFGGELFNTIDLMSDTALYLLARPGTSQNIRNYFIKKAQDGTIVKVKDIQNAKAFLSDVEERDKELFALMQSHGFGSVNTCALDEYRGGTQDERINSAKNGLCVVAYPFDCDLISWAEKAGRLLYAPVGNIDDGAQRPFYNFWLYKNNPPSKRMVFDNYWRYDLSPSIALQRYQSALYEDTNELKTYSENLRGYVLFAPKVDEYWHAPSLAKLINASCGKTSSTSNKDIPFWMTETWAQETESLDVIAEELRASLESRADPAEIRRFLRLQSAMSQISPVLRSYLY